MTGTPRTFHEIPSLYVRPPNSPRLARRPRPPAPERWRLHRRRFLKIAGATGTGIAFYLLRMLPPAKAGHESNDDNDGNPGNDSYEIKPTCYSGGYDGECGDACCCSTDCPSCCHQTVGANHYGWHKSNGTTYQLRKNDCTASGSTDWDGWKWEESNCGCCSTKKWRCHDGKACDSNGNNCDATICPWVIQCVSTGC